MKTVSNQEYEKMAILENPIEAQVMETILSEENIPHMIVSYHDTAYDGLFQFQKGWGEIRAPRVYHKDIIDFLEDIRHEKR